MFFNSIIIVDLSNNEAKRIVFEEGKNLITSDGNHFGKSVIMKALYYTLGAEVFFPEPIKTLHFLSIVSFKLGDVEYTVGRIKNSFVLFKDNTLVEKYTSVGSFGEALSVLFDLEINLVSKDQQGTIIKTPPAFLFLPYYIDQENGWAINSYSFDKMTQFDMPQRKDSFFFHLGVFDNSFVENSRKQKSNLRKITALEKEQENYKTVIDTLKSGLGDAQMTFDVESLERTIAKRKDEMTTVLNDLVKVRSELIEAEDSYQHLLNERNVISKYLKSNKPVNIYEEDVLVECPQCGNVFTQSLCQKMKKEYLLESLNGDYTKLIEDLQRKEKQISKLKAKYSEHQLHLSEYEKALGDDQNVYDTYLKTKATKSIVDEYHRKMGENQKTIDDLTEANKAIKDALKTYIDHKAEVNSAYSRNFRAQIQALDVPSNQISGDYEPGAHLIASGAYGPRCKIAQLLTFLVTQKESSDTTVSFPVVIDSPNVLEQDKDHLESVLKTLFTWNKTDNQIIVASIEGKDIAEITPGVNVIALDNLPNHIMSKAEYENNVDIISTIISSF